MGWEHEPALDSLLSSIDFSISADENLEAIRKKKNEEIKRCHPDKNRDNVTKAERDTQMWNSAFLRTTEFLRISVIKKVYKKFDNGNVFGIVDYMNNKGISFLSKIQEGEAKIEENDFNININKSAIDEQETLKRLAKIYQGLNCCFR